MLARVEALLRGHSRADDDLRAEMEAHLEMETEENIRRGMSPDDARRHAMLASGGLMQAENASRATRPAVDRGDRGNGVMRSGIFGARR